MATRRPTDDDSGEEEATAIDLRSSSQAFKPTPSRATPPSPPSPAAGAASPAPAPKKPPQTAARPAKPMHHSEDEEATEFLSVRPSSSGVASDGASSPSSLRARGRAVPLEGAEASTPGTHPPRTSREENILADRPGPLPSRTPRPLPERQTNVKSETQTGGSQKSAPRITRIFQPELAANSGTIGISDGAAETDPGEDDEVTDPPMVRKLRPLPERADGHQPGVPERPAARPATIVVHGVPDERRTDEKNEETSDRRPKTTRTSLPTSETLEAEPADGTLVIEVPDGAVVFVNGLERGRGPSLKVPGIDRYAKHAVRIHAPGYAPWSGSVCLEGRTAAKIRPGLKPKK